MKSLSVGVAVRLTEVINKMCCCYQGERFPPSSKLDFVVPQNGWNTLTCFQVDQSGSLLNENETQLPSFPHLSPSLAETEGKISTSHWHQCCGFLCYPTKQELRVQQGPGDSKRCPQPKAGPEPAGAGAGSPLVCSKPSNAQDPPPAHTILQLNPHTEPAPRSK